MPWRGVAATKDKARTEAGFVAVVEQSINEFVCSARHDCNVIGLQQFVWILEFQSGYEMRWAISFIPTDRGQGCGQLWGKHCKWLSGLHISRLLKKWAVVMVWPGHGAENVHGRGVERRKKKKPQAKQSLGVYLGGERGTLSKNQKTLKNQKVR